MSDVSGSTEAPTEIPGGAVLIAGGAEHTGVLSEIAEGLISEDFRVVMHPIADGDEPPEPGLEGLSGCVLVLGRDSTRDWTTPGGASLLARVVDDPDLQLIVVLGASARVDLERLPASLLNATWIDLVDEGEAAATQIATALRSGTGRMRLQEAVPTHGDHPARVDNLGRRALAEVLADRIRRARGEDTENPGDKPLGDGEGALLIHVHAPWGAGKSSLLSFLRDELESPRDARLAGWVIVEFNAWQHQRLAPPWWWLLAAIRREGLRTLRRRSRYCAFQFWIRDVGWRLWNARPTLLPIVIALGIVAIVWLTDVLDLGARPEGVETWAKAITAVVSALVITWGLVRGVGRWVAFGGAPAGARVLERVHDPLNAAQRRFAFLIDRLQSPVAILVEDLDRCRVEYVVELLEGIQTLFLGRPVMYVFAADREWLCQSFRTHYAAFDEVTGTLGRPLGHLFLEKTFQISLEIPPVLPDTRTAFWRSLLLGDMPADQSRGASDELDQQAARLFENLHSEREITAALRTPAGGIEVEEARRRAAVRRLGSPSLQRDLQHALERFAHLVEPNPRAMKRLVNAYGVERALQVRLGVQLEPRITAQNVLWMIVKLRWPALAEYLVQQPETADLLRQAQALEDDALPPELRVFAADRAVRDVIAGREIDAQLDCEAIERLTGSTTPSSIGA